MGLPSPCLFQLLAAPRDLGLRLHRAHLCFLKAFSVSVPSLLSLTNTLLTGLRTYLRCQGWSHLRIFNNDNCNGFSPNNISTFTRSRDQTWMYLLGDYLSPPFRKQLQPPPFTLCISVQYTVLPCFNYPLSNSQCFIQCLLNFTYRCLSILTLVKVLQRNRPVRYLHI